MSVAHERTDSQDVSSLLAFFGITFAIAWGILGFYIFFNDLAVRLFGPISGSHPGFFLAVWAPAIAALLIVARQEGRSGLRRFLSRLRLWRAPPRWWLFILVALPCVFYLGAWIKGAPLLGPLSEQGVSVLLLTLGLMVFLGPIEELGWRGLALPLLQRYMAPAWAGILIGAVWGIWHLPAFYLSGTLQSEWAYLPFFFGNVCLSVIVTPIFNASRGSILVPMVYHLQLINPFWPDAQPYDTYLLAGVALAILVIFRRSLFTRASAVTEVIPPRAGTVGGR
ncbi:MAG: CPBP family intramembrane metalloprotease [Alcanivoracaceae bacterium]|nr:CPBP family intramembrane metalloprotease [Alcanivoracaceae bacterium]